MVELHPYTDIHGREYAVIITKATYTVNPATTSLSISPNQVPIQKEDQYHAEPGQSSISYPSDLSPIKKATDVLVLGHAYAPDGYTSSSVDVSLCVGDRQETVRVFGDRRWEKRSGSWHMSEAEHFERKALVFENAYGGVEPSPEQSEETPDMTRMFCEANPIGKGFASPKSASGLIKNLPLPNIENLSQLIQSPLDQPLPSGFAAVAQNWQPRLQYAGTYNDTWQTERMPLLPLDFDSHFFNVALPQCQFIPHLTDKTPISLQNASPSGLFSFALPNESIVINAMIKGSKQRSRAMLDTILIEPDADSVMLTWRTTIPCFRKFLYIDSVDIHKEKL